MAVKPETLLQRRIQALIEKRGGYVNKNWGSMISAPGIADLTSCYKGLYLAIEVKESNGTQSEAQKIHQRKVIKSKGISLLVFSVEDVEKVLDDIDRAYEIRTTGFSDFIEGTHKTIREV